MQQLHNLECSGSVCKGLLLVHSLPLIIVGANSPIKSAARLTLNIRLYQKGLTIANAPTYSMKAQFTVVKCVMVKPGNTNRKGRLRTVYLLIKVPRFVKR